MKKTAKIFCLILSLLVCAFFSACKVNFNKLKISFCSASGESLNQVRLVIDENNNDELDKMKIAVQFDGIKEKDIGDVLISALPNDLVEIGSVSYEGNKCFFDVTATTHGSGKIVAQHLTSGKTESIDLVVDKKTTKLTNVVDEYAINIPETDKQKFNFNVTDLISQDGTDKIGFKLVEGSSLPTGVTLVGKTYNSTDLAVGVEVGDKVEHGKSVEVYPVSYMDGYKELTEYKSKKIKLVFVKPLTDATFVLDTDDIHKQDGYLNLNSVFHLIAKDTDLALGGNYQFNNIKFDLKCTENATIGENLISLADETKFNYLQSYYNVELGVPSEFSNIIDAFEVNKGQIIIEAKDYSNQVANITISLTPKIAGNLVKVTKTVKIKCDVKPTEYEISVQGKIQQNNGTKNVYDIDLYDFYNSAESAYGASFTFKPISEYSYIDLKNLKIVVSPAILDVVRTTGTQQLGTNILNATDEDKTGINIATNKYLLQFYLNGRPIEFELDNQNNAVSEGIIYKEDLARIQIKYTEISENADTEILNCFVENYYSGEFEYLKSIKPTRATLQFNHKDGINEIVVNAGVLTKGAEKGQDRVDTIKDNNEKEINVKNLYLNRADKNTNNVIYIDEILGDKNKIVSSANIDVKVIGGGNYPVKLLQNKDTSIVPSREIVYSYSSDEGIPERAIMLKLNFDEEGNPTTDVGQYKIVFTYADETIYTINCLVYEKLNLEQIQYVVDGDNSIIVNKTFVDGAEKFEYPTYSADYIVKASATNTTNITITLPKQFTLDYIAGYEFGASYVDSAGNVIGNVNDLITKIEAGNQLKLTFVKGSINNGALGYVQIAMRVKTQSFNNILTKGDIYTTDDVKIKFFVYEEITKDKVSLNKTNIRGYWSQLLSPYFKDDNDNRSTANLQVNLTDANLWNYVQPQIQDENQYKIGMDLIALDSNAAYNSAEIYYTADGVELPAENHNLEYFNQHKNELFVKNTNVVWFVEESQLISTTKQTQSGIGLEFSYGTLGSTKFYVYAMIKQFNLPDIVLKCKVEIDEPIVTDNIYITSETKQITGNQGKRVISLKAGQEYVLQLDYYSKKFEELPANERKITNTGFVMVVVDKAGNVHDSVVYVENDKLIVRQDFSLTTDLSLIIFAKDALKAKLEDATYDLNNLSDLLMRNHNTAYTVIDLVVANGTRQNPYAIFTEQDFWQIGENSLSKTKFYRLMSNIYLSTTKSIDDFSGGIDTVNNSTFYTIYGVKLNNNVPNLFTNLSGELNNICFEAKLNYNDYKTSNENSTQYLGLIDQTNENAKLNNVCATIVGLSNSTGNHIALNGNKDRPLYFGGLVGKNNGKIVYNLSTITGVDITATIKGNYLFVGGVVGLNAGSVTGYAATKTADGQAINTTAQKVVFTSYVANQGAVANLNISASGFDYGAIGGVVGLNQGGLSNVYVAGKILSYEGTLNNVGGVIGKNQQAENIVKVETLGPDVTKLTFANELEGNSKLVLQSLKSSVQIQANNNVGGITGVDENGIYVQSKYQILSSSTFGIKANNNVGGIVGNATNTQLTYCSVYSYRWDYKNLSSIGVNSTDNADITANTASAGLIGYAMSSADNIEQGDLVITAIKNSSVNGYISGKQINALVGKRSEKPNAVLDCYFAGNVKSNSQVGFKGDANGNAENENVNYAYINSINTQIGTIVNAEGNIARQGWNKQTELNGELPYILQQGEELKPVFDVAPTSITLTIKEEAKATYGVKDNNAEYVKNLINIDLYDYILNQNSDTYLKDYQIQTERNTHSISNIYEIKAEPANLLDEVRLSLSSSNVQTLMISNGNLVARSSGAATIKFTSVLNKAVMALTYVSVGKPIGETVKLELSRDGKSLEFVGSETKPTETQTIALTKGEAVLLKYSAIGYDGNNDFDYVTNEQTYLRVKVSAWTNQSGTYVEDTTININDYLLVSGVQLESNSVDLSYNTPFSIKAIQKIEDVKFKFAVTPYIKIDRYEKTSSQTIYFDVETASGISAIALDSESIVLYPNDTTTITAILTTDKQFESETDIFNLINRITLNSTEITNKNQLKKYLSVKQIGELKNGIQIVKFTFVVPEDIVLNTNTSNTMYINFRAAENYNLGTGAESSLKLTLLKQRIDEIVVRNYVYERKANGEFDFTKYYQNNTLRPVSEGLITIDIAPINGNYDYLEISDITGTEEIVFVQTDGVHGRRILDDVVASLDGKGIRLKSQTGGGKIYLASMIDANYTNRKHTVQVRAYVDGQMIKSTTMQVDVKMLPEVNIYLVNKDGTIIRNTATQYVAQNTKVRFKVETKNSDDIEPIINVKVGGSTLEYVAEGNGFYSVNLPSYDDNSQKYLEISATTQLTLNNGNVETSSSSQNYQIANFVINNVSVTHSTTNNTQNKNETKIYGNLGANVPIEFYFKNADLTYFDNLFEYTKATYQDVVDINNWVDASKQAIGNILTEINGANALNYLSFDISNLKEDQDKYNLVNDDNVKQVVRKQDGKIVASVMIDGSIKVCLVEDLNIDLALTLPLRIENNNFVIENSNPTLTLKYIYKLDFIEESSFLEPMAVRSEEDFVNMSSSGDYILAKDLTFDSYTPIDVNLNSFDGNGHTITINSFGLFNQADIKAGLFNQIYEDMVVMNLNVKYNLGSNYSNIHYDLCNDASNVSYTSASFGGITATNNGVITNCKVLGYVKLSASSVEQAVADNSIDFNIGGLVCENLETGKITNSASELQITAKANIAGVVYSNSGKIASTYFDANTGKGKIYAYNNDVTVPYTIQVAGFALNNETSGEISMCYVESQKTSNIGNISAKDYSSGFVYTNSGSVYDCYADIELIGGSSNNHIAGFVFENSGSVKNSYSYINNGRKTNLISMFAPEKTTGIENCYEIKQDVAGYKNNVAGLTTISVLNRTYKESYPTFMFGNNTSAVWTKTSVGLPKLVATQEKVEFTGSALPAGDENKQYPQTYYGLKNLQLQIVEVKNDLGVVVSREYKYNVVANNFGDKQNPILIYNLATWDYYLGQSDPANSYYGNTKYYFRMVNDIDFASVYENPSTSSCAFNGNLQGNNMDIKNFKVYSSQNLSNIGLFGSLNSVNNLSVESSVRNIHLLPTSVNATRTQAVGSLAGISENYNLYNIQVEAQDLTIVGGNAVGGAVGFVRGRYDIDGISSNVGAYSSRSQQDNSYSVFMANYQNNGFVSSNLSSVYYAGGVFGIVDGITNQSKTNIDVDLDKDLQFVRHLSVDGNLIMAGETVGATVGLVGKNTKLVDVSALITGGNFAGYQYSAGLVGENRGIISNAKVKLNSSTLFNNSTNVSAGLVGFNFNGLIENASIYMEIAKTNQSIVAGAVGRNLNGYISNITVDGKLSGYFVGGIVGADYNTTTFANRSYYGGSGAIRLTEDDLIKMASSTFDVKFKNFSNLSLTKSLVDNFILDLSSYYTIKQSGENESRLTPRKVFGLIVGLTDSNKTYATNYGYDAQNKKFVVNGAFNINGIGCVQDSAIIESKTATFGLMNIVGNYDLPKDCKTDYAILYLVGAQVSSFDFWMYNLGYSSEVFAISKNSKNLTFTSSNEKPVYIKKVKDINHDGALTKMSINDEYVLFDSETVLTDINLDILNNQNVLVDKAEGKEYVFSFDATNKVLKLVEKVVEP